MSLPLAAILDTAAAGPLRQTLRQAIDRGEPLTLDGQAVERVGQACLQVLVAARIAARARGLVFTVAQPSPALAGMATLAGLSPLVIA